MRYTWPDINLNWLQMTSNTVASISVGLVSTDASIFTLVVHTIIRVYLTPGVNLVLLLRETLGLLMFTFHPPILEHMCRTPFVGLLQ